MTTPLLDVSGLSVSLGGKPVLQDVAFTMQQGEIRAIIGPNGAGKSTCVRCLAGVVAGWTGGIRLDGRAQAELSRRELARLVCYLPQIGGALPAFSVWEYVSMGRYAHIGLWDGLGARDAEAIDRALHDVDIIHLRDRRLTTLSGGERQMAAIAAGLAQEARLLVLDEPATFLDPLRQDMLLELVGRIHRERGVSVLMVTHDVNAAMLHTHRTLALRGGRVVFDGLSGELADDATLRRIYAMDFAFAPVAGGHTLAVSKRMAGVDTGGLP
ncbi:MAG: ABC transporter ATP-binding protein [Planctomycetaceae bacterium]|nr:ABC transporter ATP-binding protein [Planctomycetaceae bacterium]